MESLNKSQLILLVLLVSFVTSIGTGVMTTALLQQAPVEITKTINQVVEKTIEKVVPEKVTGMLSSQGNKEVTTVVVKEEDQIIAAIDKNVKSIVRVNERDSQGNTVGFYGIGLVVSRDGQVVANKRTITAGNVYFGTFSDGTNIELNPLGVDKKTNFIVFVPLKPNQIKVAFTPASFGEREPQLGQSVISLGGDTDNAVAVGRVSFLSVKETTLASTTTKTLVSIDTDIQSRDIVLGSPLFSFSGDIVGIQMNNENPKSFSPISLLRKELSTLTSSQKTQ
jgi:hypothetical protein